MKTLIVVDMQNDFITGPLGTPKARAIVPKVKKKIEEYHKNDGCVIFTRDTHFDGYLDTIEGKHLPVEHCIVDTTGWEITPDISSFVHRCINKRTFGYDGWYHHDFNRMESVEIVGLCTDICVISNAILLKTYNRNVEITVDASCCAGTTPENHKAALQVMKSCQINVINE